MANRDSKGKFIKGHASFAKTGKRPNFHGNQTSFKKGLIPWNKQLGVFVPCMNCLKIMNLAKHQLGRKKFCSKECLYESQASSSYGSIHRWIRRKMGKALICTKCFSTHTVDWANISGMYFRDTRDWMQMCRNCHFKYDIVLREKGKSKINVFDNKGRRNVL